MTSIDSRASNVHVLKFNVIDCQICLSDMLKISQWISINSSNFLRTVSSLAAKKCQQAISKQFVFHQICYHQKLDIRHFEHIPNYVKSMKSLESEIFLKLIKDILVELFWRTAIHLWNLKDMYSLKYQNLIFFLEVHCTMAKCLSKIDKTMKHR